MHTSTLKYILSALIASATMVGCATSKTPVLDEHFGEAVNAAKAQQTINPDASMTNEAVYGIDGAAADAAVDQYHKSFTQPPVNTNVFNIGIGSSSGTGSSSTSSSGTR